MPRHSPDLVIIGAGVVGAACAYYAARAGLRVAVVDRGPVAGGTTGAGEGNLLVSDKEAGPELDLALLSARLWRELALELPEEIEYEAKGGLVVAADEATVKALRGFADGQRAAGVDAVEVGPGSCANWSPTSPRAWRVASSTRRTPRSSRPRRRRGCWRRRGVWRCTWGRRSRSCSVVLRASCVASVRLAATSWPRRC